LATTPAPEEEPAEAPKAAAKSDAAFAAGDTVSALYDEEDKWYDAIVQRDYEDGTFMVTWTEDGYEYTQKAEQMKLKKKATVSVDFQAGDPIEAYYDEDEKWHPARLKTNNGDGTLQITWDEDGNEQEIKPEHVRPPTPKIALSDLEPGQKFTGRVVSVAGFGAFVDIGAERDGLVHISKIANERIDNMFLWA